VFQRIFAALRATLTGSHGTPQTPAMSRAEPGRVEESVLSASSSPTRADRSPSRERIAIHVYHRWLSRGKPIGTDREDWFEAERQFRPTS
jgi:hypothetical protein